MLKEMKSNRGFTLIELIVSIAILALVMIPISDVFIGAFKTNRWSGEKMYANQLAQKYMEKAKADSLSTILSDGYGEKTEGDMDISITAQVEEAYNTSVLIGEMIQYQAVLGIEDHNVGEGKLALYRNDEKDTQYTQAVEFSKKTDSEDIQNINIKILNNEIRFYHNNAFNLYTDSTTGESYTSIAYTTPNIKDDINLKIQCTRQSGTIGHTGGVIQNNASDTAEDDSAEAEEKAVEIYVNNETERNVKVYIVRSKDNKVTPNLFTQLGGLVRIYDNLYDSTILSESENADTGAYSALYKITVEVSKDEKVLSKMVSKKKVK